MKQLEKRRREDGEQEIVDYLRDHPDFFEHHLNLLSILRVPHPTGRATSLLERQIETLREEKREHEKRLRELIEVARENDQLSNQIQSLAIGLIAARDLTATLGIIEEVVEREFAITKPVLRVAARPLDSQLVARSEFVHPDEPGLDLFAEFFRAGRAKCGRLQGAQTRYLFGDRSDQIASAALIPLLRNGWRGLLALGGERPERFQPSMGTLFLGRIGELVGHAIDPWVAPYES